MRYLILLAPMLLAAQRTRVEPFAAETRTTHDRGTGLPSEDVLSMALDSTGAAWAATREGLAVWRNGAWSKQAGAASLVAAGDGGVWFASDGALWRIAPGA